MTTKSNAVRLIVGAERAANAAQINALRLIVGSTAAAFESGGGGTGPVITGRRRRQRIRVF